MPDRPISVGDIVTCHPEAEMNIEWLVTAVHTNGRLTIEIDLVDGTQIRTVRQSAFTRDCQVIARQMPLVLD